MKSAKPKRTQAAARSHANRVWPKRALALFLLLVAVVYSLVFLTGDHKASPKLGIDLQGGTRVTLVPQGKEPTKDQLAQARTILENRVNGMGVSGASVVVDGNTLVITVAGEDTSQVRTIGQTSQLMFRPVIDPNMPQNEQIGEFVSTLGDMANRWVESGVIEKPMAEAIITQLITAMNEAAQDPAQKVEAPAIDKEPLPEADNTLEASKRRQEITAMLREDRQSDDPLKQFAAMSLLQCQTATEEGAVAADPLAGTDDPKRPLVTCDVGTGRPIVLDQVPLLEGVTDPEGPRLTGNTIDTNRPITGGLNPQTNQMEINFAFSQEGEFNGSSTWAALTAAMLQKQIAITLDSQVISAPVIQSPTPVGSATSITGQFTQTEAEALANNLKYGALPLSFAGENGEPGGTAQTVPPSLGIASLKAGIIAGIVGLILVAIFVFAYYRLFGLISLFTLFAAGALVYGSLVLLGRWIGYTLDLSGVAGLIIGIGTTADSFVVLYERVKDEVRRGRTFRSATRNGWDRAKETIVTGNIVTLLGAVVIYVLAVGEVKGFAFTMGLTTVFDLVVTFLVTAPLMILASRSPFWSRPAVNGMGRAFESAKYADVDEDEIEINPAEVNPAQDDAEQATDVETAEPRISTTKLSVTDPQEDK
ncbi:protein translocase subunit SecD [Corynebacterium aquatimens]|uniref:Protein translocase subunit SecD n=1 Tax=Corynebacterium aquatimens TaxID=1190508 RepID=A0A931GS62_9CORY|nr:protein translocase subunit SecD [Corynebacterium aquatimens]MBG6121722.1 preprotein translocase subunit SecD [Corynebacterium aquatimens]